MKPNVQQYVSDLMVVLVNHPVRWVRALGFTLSSMDRVFTDTITQTMAVDGRTFYVNNHWCLGRSKMDNLFTMGHEALHVWLRHPLRLRDTAPHLREAVAMAADYAVNLSLELQGMPWPMPEDALINRSYKDENGHSLNVERILHKMLEDALQQQPGDGDEGDDDDDSVSDAKQVSGSDDQADDGDEAAGAADSGADTDTGEDDASSGGDVEGDADSDPAATGAGDGVEDNSEQAGSNAPTPESCGELLPAPDDLDETDVGRQLTSAVQLSKGAGGGEVPEWMLQEVHAALQNSETNWLDQLRERFADAMAANDYSFERFNEPYLLHGMVEPVLYSEEVGRIAIVGDESSSMSNEALQVTAEQIAAIVAEWEPQEVLAIRHTTRITHVEELVAGQEPTPRERRSTGGTYFNPVLDYCEDKQVEAIVWVSDMYPCDTVRDTSIPVIWLGTERGSERAWEHKIGYGDYIQVADL